MQEPWTDSSAPQAKLHQGNPCLAELPHTELSYLCTSHPVNPGSERQSWDRRSSWHVGTAGGGTVDGCACPAQLEQRQGSPRCPHPPAHGGFLLRAAFPYKQISLSPSHIHSRMSTACAAHPPSRMNSAHTATTPQKLPASSHLGDQNPQ